MAATPVAATPKFETETGSIMALGGVFRSVVKRATGGRAVRQHRVAIQCMPRNGGNAGFRKSQIILIASSLQPLGTLNSGQTRL